MRELFTTPLAILSFIYTTTAQAQLETVHADLPLWTKDWEKMWPRHFTDGDSFGCTSAIAFGDWSFRQAPDPQEVEADGDAETAWLRISNYGVFHCYVIVRQGYQRGQLGKEGYKYGHFVDLGKDGRGRRLFALQIGNRPGSDYLLLAHKPGEGIISSFEVLAIDCPKRFIRSAGNIDIMGTEYCAINERADFLNFVRAMAKKPPAGTLTLVERDTAGNDDEPDEGEGD